MALKSAKNLQRGARLAQMFERHAGAIGRALRRQGMSAEAVEDATQQVFLIASQRLDERNEVAERLGIPPGTAASRRRRAERPVRSA